MKKTAKELDIVLQGWLEEHKQKKVSDEEEGEQDFMDIMMSILDGGAAKASSFDANTINKANCPFRH
ncbi:unnamed protein product [Ilex paraguariensis]|uniref:Uncharacterized protein n=1 Tax=Ilex paraguariensis TaxID=185542 RepID=A0ABC8TQL1_9AQUA